MSTVSAAFLARLARRSKRDNRLYSEPESTLQPHHNDFSSSGNQLVVGCVVGMLACWLLPLVLESCRSCYRHRHIMYGRTKDLELTNGGFVLNMRCLSIGEHVRYIEEVAFQFRGSRFFFKFWISKSSSRLGKQNTPTQVTIENRRWSSPRANSNWRLAEYAKILAYYSSVTPATHHLLW